MTGSPEHTARAPRGLIALDNDRVWGNLCADDEEWVARKSYYHYKYMMYLKSNKKERK